MKEWLLKNSVGLSHVLVSRVVRDGDTVVDATCGNGKDTLFLARLVGEQGRVYAIDIQPKAITNTKKLLEENGLSARMVLIQDDHRFIDRYVNETIKAVMFNLGYLPGGKKDIITRPDSTVGAIKSVLPLLAIGGLVTLVVYTRHPGGREEMERVVEFVSALDQTRFHVIKMEFLNQVNEPPQLVAIQKLGSELSESQEAFCYN